MAKFNPTLDPIVNSGKITSSRGSIPNQSLGDLFAGVGKTLGDVSAAWDASENMKIHLEANKQVNDIVDNQLAGLGDQPPSQQGDVRPEMYSNPTITNPTDLPSVGTAVANMARIKNALDSGKVTQAYAEQQFVNARKDLVAKHPFFAPEVDTALSRAIGSSVGYDLLKTMQANEKANISAIDKEKKFNSEYYQKNEDEIGYLVDQGILPKQDYVGGNFNPADIAPSVAKLKSQKFALDAKKAELEVGKAATLPVAQEDVNSYINSVFAVGNQRFKDYQETLGKSLADGNLSAEEKANINAQLNILITEGRMGMLKVLSKYPTLEPGANKQFRDQYDEYAKATQDFFNDPNQGIMAAQERYMKDVTLGEQTKLLDKPPILTASALMKLGVPPEWIREAVPDMVRSVSSAFILKDDNSIKDTYTTLKDEGKNQTEINNAVLEGANRTIQAISDPRTTPENMQKAFDNLFGSDEALSVLRNLDMSSREKLYYTLISPEMTKKALANPKWEPAYTKFVLQQFSSLIAPLINQEKQNVESTQNYGFAFDEKTGHFSVEYVGDPSSPGAALGNEYYQTNVNKMNKLIDSVTPVLEYHNRNVSSWVKDQFQTDDIKNLTAKSPFLLKLLESIGNSNFMWGDQTKDKRSKKYINPDGNPQGGSTTNPPGTGGAPGPQGSNSSNPVTKLLTSFEGFAHKAMWDVNAWRAGYGSDTITKPDGSVQRVQRGMKVSKADALRDLERRVPEFQKTVVDDIGEDKWNSLSDNQKAVLTSIAYNYGELPKRVIRALSSNDPTTVGEAIAGLQDDNNGINRKRRLKEAELFASN